MPVSSVGGPAGGAYAPPGSNGGATSPPLGFGSGPSNTLDEPVWDTIKRDLLRIYKNLVSEWDGGCCLCERLCAARCGSRQPAAVLGRARASSCRPSVGAGAPWLEAIGAVLSAVLHALLPAAHSGECVCVPQVMVVFPFKDRSQQSAALRNWDLVRHLRALPWVFSMHTLQGGAVAATVWTVLLRSACFRTCACTAHPCFNAWLLGCTAVGPHDLHTGTGHRAVCGRTDSLQDVLGEEGQQPGH